MKRTLAFLLSLLMTLSVLPTTALATDALGTDTPVIGASISEDAAQPAEEDLQLFDAAGLTIAQNDSNVVVTYTVPDMTTAATELQLWRYDSATDRSKPVTHEYCDDLDDWTANTFSWVIDGAAFAEHGEGHYYCTTADGTVESSKLEYAYADDAVQLTAPTDVVLNGDILTWTCDNPVMAVIEQESNGQIIFQDYSHFSKGDSVTDLLEDDAAAGLYKISLFAYSRKDYVNNLPSEWVTVEYQYSQSQTVSDPLTRMEMVYLLVDAFELEYDSKKMTKTFSDVTDADDAKAVAIAIYYGIANGTSETTFSPDSYLTRGQLATILTRALELPAGSARPTDVPENQWFATAVSSVVDAALMSVDTNNNFYPHAFATTDDVDITKLNVLAAEPVASGSCGASLTWSLSQLRYELTITGTGAMEDFDDAPWSDWSEDITAVSLPEGLTHLGDSALYKCGKITEITLPASLESIGSRGLASCWALKTLHIPAKVTRIDSNALGFSESLTSISVDPANTTFRAQDGFLLTYDSKTLVACPGGLDGTVTLPTGITTIGNYACCGSMAESFVLPDSIEIIARGAFDRCCFLESIEIPASVTELGRRSFYTCEDLRTVTFLGNAPAVGDDVFALCHDNFRILYDPDTTGWTTPEWNGWPAYPIGTIPSASAPVDLQWNTYRNSSGSTNHYELGTISFGRQNTGAEERFRVDFYRKDVTGDVKIGTLWTRLDGSRSYRTMYPFEDLDDVFTSGTYYFTVTPIGDGVNTVDGKPVRSDDWTYTRPSVKLGVSDVQWGTDMSINWTTASQNDNYLDYYQLQYQYVAPGKSFDPTDWNYGTSYHPNDRNDFPYPPEDMLYDCGSGKYYFRVRAISKDINTAVYSDWSDWSEAFDYTRPAITLTVSDLQWNGNTLSWTPDFSADAPLAGYRIYVYENYDDAVSGSSNWWGWYAPHAGDTSYTLTNDMLEDLVGNTWYFAFTTISKNPAVIASNYGSVSVCEQTFTAPDTPAAPATDLQWHLRRWNEGDNRHETGMISFGGTIPQDADRARFQVDIYRREANGNTHIGTTHISLHHGDAYTCVQPFEHFADKFTSGTYYFTVTALGDGVNTCDGPAVTSGDWTYTRPNVKLGVSAPKWASNMSISWTDAAQNRDYINYYDLQYQYVGPGQSFYEDNWNYGTSYSPDSSDVLYPPEALMKDRGNGKYYFRVRANSDDVTVAVPSNWSEWSEAFDYTEPATTLTVSDVKWNGNTLSWTPDFNSSAPLLRYNITVYQNINNAVSNPNNWRDRYTVPTGDTSFTLDPWMVENLGNGTWFFVVNTVSSDPTKAASNFGLGQGCTWTYTAPSNKLGTPTDLAWHIDYNWQWDDATQTDYQVPFERKGSISFKRPVDQKGNFIDQGEYDIEVYRIEANGTHVRVNNAGRGIGSMSTDTHVADQNFIYGDFPSGTYYFKVRCRADGVNYASSDWVDSRDFPNGIYEYKQATKRLPTPTGLYWDDRTFINWDSGKSQVAALWSPVENGVYYGVEFRYAETEDGVKKGYSGSRDIRQWGDEPLHDTLWDWLIGEYGDNWYFFQVQAFPANIEEYRVSEWSAYSIGYPMGFVESNAEAKLDSTINSALSNLQPGDKLTNANDIQAVQNAVASIPLLDEAMMSDNDNSGTVEKIETLEKAIGKADVDTTNAPAGFESDKVKVTGAVLNAGGDATLSIGKVDQNGVGGPSDLIHTQYNNTIPFTLNIAGAQDADGDPNNGLTLNVPVKITLPIPGNINPAFLVVLHYKQSTDQWEELHMPHVYQENGKWFASFTVTSMSPFSLAEKQVDVWRDGDYTIRISAHLASGNDDTQYLCAVYSTDGQLLGVSILEPHSNSVRVELNQPVPDNYDVKIIAAASGNGWMPVGNAQTIEIRNH